MVESVAVEERCTVLIEPSERGGKAEESELAREADDVDERENGGGSRQKQLVDSL